MLLRTTIFIETAIFSWEQPFLIENRHFDWDINTVHGIYFYREQPFLSGTAIFIENSHFIQNSHFIENNHFYWEQPFYWEQSFLLRWKHNSWQIFLLVAAMCPLSFPLWYSIQLLWTECSLTHIPLVPHTCVSDMFQHWLRSWLVAFWRQAITWANVASVLIGTNLGDIWIEILAFSFKIILLRDIACEMAANLVGVGVS